MTVAENLYLGRFPRKNGLIDYSQLYRNAAELFAQLRFQINPRATMRELSLANIQLVEIAKALSQNARVIIMDEPTSALGEEMEADAVAKKLNGKGNVVIFDGPIGQSAQIERSAGIKKALQKYPNIKVLEEKTANWSRTEGLNVNS